MSISKTLYEIITYLKVNRLRGHTTAVIRGAQNVDNATLVCHNEAFARSLGKTLPKSVQTTSLGSIAHGSLRGKMQSLVFDNAAISELAEQCLSEIETLQNEVERLTKKLDKASNIDTTRKVLDKLSIKQLAQEIIKKEQAVDDDFQNGLDLLMLKI